MKTLLLELIVALLIEALRNLELSLNPWSVKTSVLGITFTLNANGFTLEAPQWQV